MYKICSQISWADVIDKLNYEVHSNTATILGTTFVLHNYYRPNTLQKAYDEVLSDEGDMHVYVSLTSDSPTFGKHKDEDDVLIIQAIGSVKYFIENEWVTLVPGEYLYIPKGIYHTPVVLTPRVTLSFASVTAESIERPFIPHGTHDD